MSKLAKISNAIYKGNGKAANVLGELYNVYRLSPTSNSSFTLDLPIASNFPATLARYTKRDDIENTTFELIVFSVIADGRRLMVGDILWDVDPVGGVGTYYCIASMRPLKTIIAIRTESLCNLSRAQSLNPSMATNVVSSIIQTNYAASYNANELICVLINGQYSFVDPTTNPYVAQIPFGFEPQSRKGNDHQPGDLPTQVSDSYFVGYMPLLPGIDVQETDIVTTTDGLGQISRYEVIQVFTTNNYGISGWVLHLVKLSV